MKRRRTGVAKRASNAMTVLVRFGFGPTPHGACGTYFLQKKDGSWAVVWRDLAYYV